MISIGGPRIEPGEDERTQKGFDVFSRVTRQGSQKIENGLVEGIGLFNEKLVTTSLENL